MKNKNLLLFLSIITVSLFACEKTENGTALTPQERALTNKVWKLKSLTVPKVNESTQDSSITKPCSDSALMAFDLFNQFQLAYHSKSCDSLIVPYDKGIWKLSADNDTLYLRGRRTLAWKIESLNDTILKATFRDSISPDKNVVKKITLK